MSRNRSMHASLALKLVPKRATLFVGAVLILYTALAPRFARAADVVPADTSVTPEILNVSLLLSAQVDRTSPGGGLGSSIDTQSPAAGAELDFNVVEFHVPRKSAFGSVHVFGRLLYSDRTVMEDTTGANGMVGQELLQDTRCTELTGGLRVGFPVISRGRVALSRLYLKYEASSIFPKDTDSDLLDVTTYAAGFERSSGALEGSFFELGYGHNGILGSTNEKDRWKVHAMVQTVMTRGDPSRRNRGTLTAYGEIYLDTDNGSGPDGLRAMLGMKLNTVGLVQAVQGLLGI